MCLTWGLNHIPLEGKANSIPQHHTGFCIHNVVINTMSLIHVFTKLWIQCSNVHNCFEKHLEVHGKQFRTMHIKRQNLKTSSSEIFIFDISENCVISYNS